MDPILTQVIARGAPAIVGQYITNAVTMCFLSLDYYGRQEDSKEAFLESFLLDLIKDTATLLTRQTILQQGGHQAAAHLVSIQEYLITRLESFDPYFYKFRLNPQELTLNGKKIQSSIITNRGVDTWNWEDELDVWGYKGTSGYMKPPSPLLALGITDLRLSPAWMRFKMFDRFYHLNNGEMVMIFEENLMKCHMNDFSFTRSADNPWRIDFSFSVRSDHRAVIDLLSGDISGFFEKEKDLFEDSWKGELL